MLITKQMKRNVMQTKKIQRETAMYLCSCCAVHDETKYDEGL